MQGTTYKTNIFIKDKKLLVEGEGEPLYILSLKSS